MKSVNAFLPLWACWYGEKVLVPEVLGKMAEMPEVAPAPAIWTETPWTSTVTLSRQSNSLAQVNRASLSLIAFLSCWRLCYRIHFCIAPRGRGRSQSSWTVMDLGETQASSDTRTGPTVIYRFPYYRSVLGSRKFSRIQLMTQTVYNPRSTICNCKTPSPSWRIDQISASHKHPSLAGSLWNSDGRQTLMTPQKNPGEVTNNSVECLSVPWSCTIIKGNTRISCNLAGQYVSYDSPCQSKSTFWGGGEIHKNSEMKNLKEHFTLAGAWDCPIAVSMSKFYS